MLHAPVTETKNSATKTQSPSPSREGRDLHPHLDDHASPVRTTGPVAGAASRQQLGRDNAYASSRQASHGNQATLRMLSAGSASGGILRRRCACGGTPGPTGECAACRAKRLARQQRAATSGTPTVAPPVVHDALRSPGQPMDPASRAFMETRFGRGFENVRVHTDSRAAESARAVDALAYTVGQRVVFSEGQYEPSTPKGRDLLAHELAHVVQQGAGGIPSELVVGQPGDAPEREADAVARAVVSGSDGLHQFRPRTGEGDSALRRQLGTEDDQEGVDTAAETEEETDEDDGEVHDGDSPVDVSSGAEVEAGSTDLEETAVPVADQTETGEAAGADTGEAVEMAGGKGGKAKPAPKPPAKKATRTITSIDVDLAAQTLVLNFSDGTKSNPHPISSGRGLPNTKDDPCKTQNEKNCTPTGDYTVYGKGDANTKNQHGDRMSWYVGLISGRGIGIHDSQPLPGTPHSHGCIRVGDSPADDAFAKMINQNIVVGTTVVHIKGKAPTTPWTKPAPKPKTKKKK